MNTLHTPLPWSARVEKCGSEYVVRGSNGQIVLLIADGRRALPMGHDAEFMLRAVNSHEELMGALRELTTTLSAQAAGYLAPDMWHHTRARLIDLGTAALLRAEGKATTAHFPA